MLFQIPAVCPTCSAVFPSGIAMDETAIIHCERNRAGPCPNGHMGLIPDGTYSVLNGFLQLSRGQFGAKSDLKTIHTIAVEAQNGSRPLGSAIDAIAALLPDDAAAAVRKFGTDNPLGAILFVIVLLGIIGNSVAGIAAGYNALFTPNTPTQNISNYGVIINESDAKDETEDSASKQLSRPERRRREKEERQKRKRERKRSYEAGERGQLEI